MNNLITTLKNSLIDNYDISVNDNDKIEIVFYGFEKLDQIKIVIDILNSYNISNITCLLIPRTDDKSEYAYYCFNYDADFF